MCGSLTNVRFPEIKTVSMFKDKVLFFTFRDIFLLPSCFLLNEFFVPILFCVSDAT